MICLIVARSKFLLNLLNSTLSYNKYSVDTILTNDFDNKLVNNILNREYNTVVIEISEIPDSFYNILNSRKEQKRPHLIGIIRKNDWKERVKYLKLGFNEIFSYPFSTQELLVKINKLSPNIQEIKNLQLTFGDISIDIYNKKVIKSNKEIPLNKKEFQILEYLAHNNSRVISRNELFDHVWEYQKIYSSNTVDVHISRIRKKMKQNIIQTYHGTGYKLKKIKASLA